MTVNLKPTELKVLEGNLGKRPLPEDEPKFDKNTEGPPKWLDAQARRSFKKIAKKLSMVGLLTEADTDAFAFLCQIRSRLIDAITFLNKENPSMIQVTEKPAPDGGVIMEQKKSPYIQIEKEYYVLYRQYASEFGLTPRGRTGLSVGQGKKEGLEDLID